MSSLRTKSNKDVELKSEPLKNFESNLDGVQFFLKETGSRHIKKRVNSLRRFKSGIKSGVIPDVTRLNSIGSGLKNDVQMIHFRNEWIGVMLITFLMTYLEDALIILAERNNDLLKDMPTIDPRRLFEAASIDEIRVEITRAWAERILRGTGPEGWSKRISDFGARGYLVADIAALQHLFDTRNCIIHTNGIARPDYLKKYPTQKLESGRIRIALSQLTLWLEAVAKFVETTDAFLLKYPSTS